MKLPSLFRSLLRRVFFWRNWSTVSKVASRAVRDGYTLLSDSEAEAAKDWAEEYARRVKVRKDDAGGPP